MGFIARRIYVASSWRNYAQAGVVMALRRAGHEVYDFRHPGGVEDKGFHWTEIDPDWKQWSPEQFRDSLQHPIATRGFKSDFDAMEWADTCVLVMPCGRSAHLEAGYFVGAGKSLYIMLADGEPELMYRMATGVCVNLDELFDAVGFREGE
jgi:hypothetical protein